MHGEIPRHVQGVDEWWWFYPAKLGKGFVDEDEGDEDGEDFLGEARDEANQEAPLARYNQHHNDDQPHSHPYSTHDVLEALRLAELNKAGGDWENSIWGGQPKMIDNELIHMIVCLELTAKKASSNTKRGPEKPITSTGWAATKQKIIPWMLVEMSSSETPIMSSTLSAKV